MGLRTADRFQAELLGKIKIELSVAEDDMEEAAKEVRICAGADFVVGKDEPFERITGASGRLREHRATVLVLQRVEKIIRELSVSE